MFRLNADGSITFAASLPPIQSAILLDGNGDGARVKLDIPRTDVQAALQLQGWAESLLIVTIKQSQDDRE